jgi:OOP family OmpA-OmpF porin
MRLLFIAATLFATLLTFYSALWYKSEQIETDITARVTDDLDTAQTKNIAIDVNGRHVTLSGIVNDAATETAYLDTANDTYGALGPIDGLTLQNASGFLKAVKSDDGITLTGAVPTEAVRASLFAAAAQGTQGKVVDAMTIGAIDGAWTDEAGFGLAQMAQLSSAALSVTPDSYTLSGTATGDATPVRQSLADRTGWQSFVSAPSVESDLSMRLTSLKSDVEDRDVTIKKVTSERDTLAASLTAMTAARDLAVTKHTATSSEITLQRDGLTQNVADLTAERATLTAERDTAVSDLDTLRASLDDTQSGTAALRAELDDVQTGLDTTTAQVVQKDTLIEGLNGQITDLTTNNAALSAELETQKASLTSDQQEGAELRNQIAEQTASINALITDRTARDATIATLEDNLTEAGDARTAALGQIETLTQTLQDRDAQMADLTGQADTGNQAAAKVAALTGQVQSLQTQTDKMVGNVSDLTAVVAERDATIADLRANVPAVTSANVGSTSTSTQFAAQCGARAGSVLQDTKINFGSGTAQIERQSVDVMERLTGIALACSDSGLTVEIGGHTDSQGSDESNQNLSERRAQAIAAFMVERGVPEAALSPVGFGETQPIGDNETSQGRAQNRRISFEWQAR